MPVGTWRLITIRRKPKTCHECGRTIQVGEKGYLRYTGITPEHLCKGCDWRVEEQTLASNV